jgi:hypothetical protein
MSNIPQPSSWKGERWTVTQIGLLLRCILRGYNQRQCAEVLEYFFHGRTGGDSRGVEWWFQSLRKEGGLKDETQQWHERSFSTWAKRSKAADDEVADINEMFTQWTTLKTHEGVLLDILSSNCTEKACASLLEAAIPNTDDFLMTTMTSGKPLEDRIQEACSRFGRQPEAVQDWIKHWKVDKEVAEILSQIDDYLAESLRLDHASGQV